MTAENWRDKDELDYPLTYVWRYRNAAGNYRELSSAQKSNSFTTKLIGISDVSHNLDV
jgi:hypothetical protein